MQRTALPIDNWLTDADAAGGPLSQLVTRLTAGADRTVPVGRRSVAITVRAAVGDTSPVLVSASGTAVLPEAATVSFVCDFPADQLATMTVTTIPGDDVMIVETYLT